MYQQSWGREDGRNDDYLIRRWTNIIEKGGKLCYLKIIKNTSDMLVIISDTIYLHEKQKK